MHLLLVEQAPQQGFERQIGIGQLVCAHAAAKHRDIGPFGMIEARVQPLAPLLALGQMLQQQAARDHAICGACHADPHQAGYLLGLGEIGLRRLTQARPLQRHDALIALADRGEIEGDGEITLAEQREQRRIGRQFGQAIGIVADIAAHLAAAIIDHEQIDRAALGLRLDGELTAGILQRRAEQRREHEGFGQDLLDRGRIAVRRQDRVERRPEPDQTAACVAQGDGETEGSVEIGGGHAGYVGPVPGKSIRRPSPWRSWADRPPAAGR